MPLRIHCPEGCLIRVPANRSGKIIRCPECKSVIRLPSVSETEIASGKPIPLQAEFVQSDGPVAAAGSFREEDAEQVDKELTELQEDQIRQQKPDVKKVAKPVRDPVNKTMPNAKPFEPLPSVRSRSMAERLPVPKPRIGKPGQSADVESAENTGGSNSNSPIPAFPEITPGAVESGFDPQRAMVQRVKSATADRIVLARFYAICLCAVAVFNLVPAIYYWYQWSIAELDGSLPRWTYLQVFVAAVHFVYAIFLFQVPDWSALRTVAVAMLVLAVMFGIVSTGLVMGGGQGNVARYLDMPTVFVRNATIWCVAMLCLSTLISYLAGRESTLWQRTEKLLDQILSNQS